MPLHERRVIDRRVGDLKPLLGEEQSPNVHFLIKSFSLAQLTALVKEVLG